MYFHPSLKKHPLPDLFPEALYLPAAVRDEFGNFAGARTGKQYGNCGDGRCNRNFIHETKHKKIQQIQQGVMK
jgi:hypothetical protein